MSAGGSDSADADLCARIEAVFAECFGARHGVRLVARPDEPLYEPRAERIARLGYLQGHPRSALHEVAHWCIAGPERRRRLDFGYWYRPGPRSALEQRRFEAVEVLPQALERLFCDPVGLDFEVSIDDLETTLARGEARFDDAVRRCAEGVLERGRPLRAMVFLRALTARFGSRCAS